MINSLAGVAKNCTAQCCHNNMNTHKQVLVNHFLYACVQIFSRDELVVDGGHAEVHVRVNNTQLGLVTYWDLAKFETRLEQMRDIYQATPTGSLNSMDDSFNSSGGEDASDPFNDPSDNWVKDSVMTPLSSPHRYEVWIQVGQKQ